MKEKTWDSFGTNNATQKKKQKNVREYYKSILCFLNWRREAKNFLFLK